MDKRDGLLIILIIALISGGIYNFYHFSSKRKSRTASVAPKPRHATATKRGNRNPPPSYPPPRRVSARTGERVEEFYFPEGWGRNPFLTPAEIKQIQASKDPLLENESMPVRQLPQYVVTSILIGDAQKVAVVNGMIVIPGDSIGREVVKEISIEGVELAMRGNRRTIKLKQGRTKIKTKRPDMNPRQAQKVRATPH